jgi:hypothetical protein
MPNTLAALSLLDSTNRLLTRCRVVFTLLIAVTA